MLQQFLSTHQGLSDSAWVEFNFDYMIRRASLKSDNSGWKAYPVTIRAKLSQQNWQIELLTTTTYSSTCPCSAALARQLIQSKFLQDFSDKPQVDTQIMSEWLRSTQGIIATPHSQRSTAKIKVELSNGYNGGFPITALIDLVESALKTPVQTAVKREDEQEFALLNGQNLMFCEDAARIINFQLDHWSIAQNYWIRVDHFESLHAHDATAIKTKGYASDPNNF